MSVFFGYHFITARLPQNCNFAPPPFGLLVLPDLGHPTICPESLYYHRALGHPPATMGLLALPSSTLGWGWVFNISVSVHYLSIFISVDFSWVLTKITWKKCRPFSMRRVYAPIDVVWKERENGKARNNNVSYLDTMSHEYDANPNSSWPGFVIPWLFWTTIIVPLCLSLCQAIIVILFLLIGLRFIGWV